MIDAETYFKAKQMMCDDADMCCYCPLAHKYRHIMEDEELKCAEFCEKYPEKAIPFIEDWWEERKKSLIPIKTNADKFFEVFGLEVPNYPTSVKIETNYKDGIFSRTLPPAWWNEPYKERL